MKKKNAHESAGRPAHSKIGASSMSRWENCPGSVRMNSGIESISSSYAEEGTLAHSVGEALLMRELHGKISAADKKLIRDNSDNKELMDAVQVYVDYILKDSDEAESVLIEHGFAMPDLHPDLYGTADCVMYFPEKKLLKVIDYKHGAGVAVFPRNNRQLMYYALGALLSTGHPCELIEMVIVQPRCPVTTKEISDQGIRHYTISLVELMDFQADLVEAAERTDKPDAPLKSGEYCRWCPAAAICPVLKDQALEKAKTIFSPIELTDELGMKPYDAKELASILAVLPEIEGWAKSVREFAYSEAMAGRVPPGYKLVEKRGTRQWLDAEKTHKEAVKKFGDDALSEPKLLSPAQLEKIKGASEWVAKRCASVSSGFNLVEVKDEREPVAHLGKQAKDVFKALKI